MKLSERMKDITLLKQRYLCGGQWQDALSGVVFAVNDPATGVNCKLASGRGRCLTRQHDDRRQLVGDACCDLGRDRRRPGWRALCEPERLVQRLELN